MIAGTLREVLGYYRAAWAAIVPLLAIHLAVRAAVALFIAPLTALVLSLALTFADAPVLTDQDIAWFLMSPWGLAGGLLLASLSVAASILDVAMMSVVLRMGLGSPVHALRKSVAYLLPRLHRIVLFAAALMIRISVLAIPFLALAGFIAWLTMTDYDINYYLVARPAGFLLGAGLIALIAAALATVLVVRLSGWAIALHLVLIQSLSPRVAFARSSVLLKGAKASIVRRVTVWVALRLALPAIILFVLGLVLRVFPELMGSNLRLIAATGLFVLALWFVANAVVIACANGALAQLLSDAYDTAVGAAPAVTIESGRDNRMAIAALLAAAVAALGISIIQGDRLLDRIAEDRTVVIIAHRGAAADRPENTMASIRKAIEDKADWIEIDVQENAEGDVIIAHDSDFMKQAGIATKVWDVSAADLATIDIGSHFDPAYSSERVPYLRDVLAEVKGRAKLMIELKYYGHDKELENKVALLVEQAGMADQVAVMSLKVAGVAKMRKLRPDWRSGVLAATAVGDLTKLDTDFLAVNTGQATLRLITRAEAVGKDVYAWTVDDPVTMSRLISLGVDGLITNTPALARQVMERRNALSTPERLMLWLADQFGIGKHGLIASEKDA